MIQKKIKHFFLSLPLKDDEKDVSCEFESLFTSIPLEEGTYYIYIIEQIPFYKNLTPICLKLIFRRVLNKSSKKVLLNSIADYSNEWIVGL